MNLLLILLVVISVNSQIETNHGCKTGCACPDFENYLWDPEWLSYTKIDECSFKLTCLNGTQASLGFAWEATEIEKPSDASTINFNSVLEGSAPFPPVDFQSTFGIICEDGFWIATKYSLIQYQDMKNEKIPKSLDNINGKKSRIGLAECVNTEL